MLSAELLSNLNAFEKVKPVFISDKLTFKDSVRMFKLGKLLFFSFQIPSGTILSNFEILIKISSNLKKEKDFSARFGSSPEGILVYVSPENEEINLEFGSTSQVTTTTHNHVSGLIFLK